VSGDARIPALDELGVELEQALLARRRRRRWRLRPAIIALVAGAALAVPAGATWIDWARLVEGETALPTQAPARVLLASGDPDTADAWRFVVYKARLAGDGRMGLCAYLVGREHGAGGCAPTTAAPALLVSDGDGGVPDVIAGLVSDRVARVELSLTDRRSLAVAPEAPDAHELRRRGLPAGLRFFVVDVPREVGLTGALARDAAGRELARSGRPGRLAAGAPALQSPVTLAEDPR
jgi:hypothetical protein